MEIRVWVPTKLPIWITFHYTPKVMHSPSALGGKAREKEMHNRKDVIAKHLVRLLIHNPQRNSEADKTAFFVLDTRQKRLRHNLLSLLHAFPEPHGSAAAPEADLLKPASRFLSLLAPNRPLLGRIQHCFPGS